MNNQFSKAITRDVQRSAFDRPFRHKTTFNAADIVPIFLDQKVLPNDTITLDMAYVVRSGTPYVPVMDDAKLTIAFFFVPMRIVWEHTKQFYGENDTSAWTQNNTYTIPAREISEDSSDGDVISVGTIGHYFGLPLTAGVDPNVQIGSYCEAVSDLPLRAYHFICNEWYRDQSTCAPVLFTKGDTATSNVSYSDAPRKAAKFHDYFTSCLPQPQRGNAVSLPLGTQCPVYTGATTHTDSVNPLRWTNINSHTSYAGNANVGILSGTTVATSSSVSSGSAIAPSNLYADLSQATAASINQLRLAIATQKFLETDARAGTRFREAMYAHYGATNAGALDIPQLICVKEFDLNMNQVLNTADETGATGAYSHSSNFSSYFTYSACEPGMIIGLACVRTVNTYSQGIHRDWTSLGKFDQYFPEFAGIGEQPVYKKEIFASTATCGASKPVFAYQEAWAEYRYKQNMATGYMDHAGANSLDPWTYQQTLTTAPTLNQAFIEASKDPVDNSLKQGSTTHNYMADFYFKARWVRPMPMYSIPGLGTGI